MSNRKNIIILIFLFAILLQGCAAGNRYNFSDVRANLQMSRVNNTSVAVGSLDQREVILSGRCPPTYVGMQRAGFGNPYRVNTESGLPFAEDMTSAVCDSLSKKGFNAIPVKVAYNLTEQQAREVLGDKKADRSVFIIIKQWESDTYTNIGLIYELRLIVFNANHSAIAETFISDTKNISGSFWNPTAAAKEKIPEAFKQTLEILLNDPKIIDTLK